MGLINMIKLANDYNKAKKLLREKKPNIDNMVGVYKSLKANLDKFKEFYNEIDDGIRTFIKEGTELMSAIKSIIGKKGDE